MPPQSRSTSCAAVPPLPALRSIELPGRGNTAVRFEPGSTPVLLLHGWAITADFNFCHVMSPIAQQFGVVAMDLPGHGRGVPLSNTERFSITQCADDASAALDVLGIDRVVVCGYSVGGAVGMEFVRRHRDRVTGVVLEATALALDDLRSRMGRVVFAGLRPLADHCHGVGRSLPLRYYSRCRSRDRRTATWWPWLRGELIGCHPRVIVDVILARYAFDFRPQVGSLAGVPSAVVVTTRDRAVPPADQREMAQLLGAPVAELDADHDVFLTQPAPYVEATLAAIGRVTSQP